MLVSNRQSYHSVVLREVLPDSAELAMIWLNNINALPFLDLQNELISAQNIECIEFFRTLVELHWTLKISLIKLIIRL